MASRNIKAELQKVLHSKFLKEFTTQLNGYERRVRQLAKDFNLKSQEARKKSKKQVDDFSRRIKKTKAEVEKTFKNLLKEESKLLNKSFDDLSRHLKALSDQDTKATKKKSTSKKRKTTRKRKTTKKKTTRKKRGESATRLKTLKSLHTAKKRSVGIPEAPAPVHLGAHEGSSGQ